MLAWIQANARHPHADYEIEAWSRFREASAPGDNGSRTYISDSIAKAGGAERDDLATWFEWLDYDDHVSFGGL